MKTRNILLAMALMGSITATAQDVTILHMKDGTTRRYTNGIKEATNINFYQFAPENAVNTTTTTTHDNGYSVEWNVSDVWNDNGQYTVFLFWQDDVPANFQARHGVLMGTKPNLSVDQCEQKAYYEEEGLLFNYSSLSVQAVHGHYMIIGHYTNRQIAKTYLSDLYVPTTTKNIIAADLQHGQTYYYRTFAEGLVEEQGQQKSVVFYGEERSFRIPNVMADNGYYSYPCASVEAVEAFATNFPEGVTPPTWRQMEPLWNLWRNSEEGKAVDLSVGSTEEFDDGIGYRLNHIPQEFYTWMTKREVVIDAFEGLTEISKRRVSNGDSIELASANNVDNVDEKWGVPGGKYIRFEPTATTVNFKVTYSSSEVVPGVHYKMLLSFAPETEIENNDSTARYFLPSRVMIWAHPGKEETNLFKASEISGTEVTTLQYEDFKTSSMGLSLLYETATTNRQIMAGTHNRIIRIAEIRLIPINE